MPDRLTVSVTVPGGGPEVAPAPTGPRRSLVPLPFALPVRDRRSVQTITAVAGHDITMLAWQAEQRRGQRGLYWRELAAANGILDPFQRAGEEPREILGEALSVARKLVVPQP